MSRQLRKKANSEVRDNQGFDTKVRLNDLSIELYPTSKKLQNGTRWTKTNLELGKTRN